MRAIERLKPILGRTAVESIIKDLKKHGIDLEDPKKTYTLVQIQDALTKLLDRDAAELLIEFISFEMTK